MEEDWQTDTEKKIDIKTQINAGEIGTPNKGLWNIGFGSRGFLKRHLTAVGYYPDAEDNKERDLGEE